MLVEDCGTENNEEYYCRGPVVSFMQRYDALSPVHFDPIEKTRNSPLTFRMASRTVS